MKTQLSPKVATPEKKLTIPILTVADLIEKIKSKQNKRLDTQASLQSNPDRTINSIMRLNNVKMRVRSGS
jgi:hypothetical protein